MTREEAIDIIKCLAWHTRPNEEDIEQAIKALEQEPNRDMEEIREIMECDADVETKCKMISNILTAKPHYFEKQEPFKPMVEIDLYSVIKQKYIDREVLDKIRAEIQKLRGCTCSCSDGIIDDVEDIIDKCEAESEVNNGRDRVSS